MAGGIKLQKDAFSFFAKLALSILAFGAAVAASLAFGAAKTSAEVVMRLRLPRVALLAISGALLGGSGKVFQMYFQNDIADPAFTGVSSAATFGIAVSVSFFR